MAGTVNESSDISANGDRNADTQQRSEQEEEWESAKSSAKLFERSRIRALAGIDESTTLFVWFI